MQISADGLALIRSFEGLRTTAYRDAGGVWTIGYGSTRGVTEGMTISVATAEAMLKRDVHFVEVPVDHLLTRPASQPQFDALVSLAYNIGTGALEHSTVLRRFNAGDIAGAADAFLMWNQVHGVVSPGLARRRAAERQLFLTPSGPAAEPVATSAATWFDDRLRALRRPRWWRRRPLWLRLGWSRR